MVMLLLLREKGLKCKMSGHVQMTGHDPRHGAEIRAATGFCRTRTPGTAQAIFPYSTLTKKMSAAEARLCGNLV